ncbi:MAG: TPM domain-containing protein [Ignavibacteriales bacterium]|nr:TPM domain-containing protein [Ignavibacteriales bacterium]
MKKIFFTEEEEQKIIETIKEFENKTSSEIVPFVINTSGNYPEANFKSAIIFGSIPVLIFMLLSFQWLLPVVITPFEIGLIFISCSVLGFIIPYIIPNVKRFFIGKDELFEQVMKRASVAFIDEDIVNTKSRNGILIYISNFEKMAIILADRGIHSKVPNDYWNDVIKIIIEKFKKGNRCEGIIKAIDKCTEILLEAGFERLEDDENELKDELKIKNE